MAQVRDIETLRKAERNILCGLGFAVLLFLIYASTSIAVPPPIKGLPRPVFVTSDQSTIRSFYNLDAPDRDAWVSLDIKLQIQGFKRYSAYSPLYRNARGERVALLQGMWRPSLAPEGTIDVRVPGKATLIHMVRSESWKFMWQRIAWKWKAKRP